ncbi:MAG: hypothetical protein M3P06_02340 [Acidobacteriota bacterium]|nr:hypothetical protein [Acidobacteriota bacterium]
MRRGVFDVLRRGADNTIANWQLILIRIAGMLVFAVLTVLAVIVALVPILVSVGIELSNLTTIDDVEGALFSLMEKWILLVWIFVAISVLLLIFIALHSFVVAGSARVYVDAERMAGPALTGARSRFRAFSMERWLAGGKDGWWTVFWIYNVAWGLAGLILLIPLLPTMLGVLMLHEKPPAAVTVGCAGLVITVLLMLIVGPLTGIWVNRSINDWAVHRFGARESLAAGRAAMRTDFGRHLLVFIAVFVVSMAGASFFSSFSFLAAFGDIFGRHDGAFSFLFPLRIMGSVLSTIFSTIVSAWYLTSYSALATE